MVRFIGGALIVCAAFGAGCSSDDSGKRGEIGGVSTSKEMQALTQDEMKKLCVARQGKFDSMSKCTPDGGGIDCETADVADLEGCSITVGEFDSCLDQMVSAFESMTCDAFDPSAIPECWANVAAKCPLFSGDGSASG